MGVPIGDTAPDFATDLTTGKISFHNGTGGTQVFLVPTGLDPDPPPSAQRKALILLVLRP
jgi:hypothetical protein